MCLSSSCLAWDVNCRFWSKGVILSGQFSTGIFLRLNKAVALSRLVPVSGIIQIF